MWKFGGVSVGVAAAQPVVCELCARVRAEVLVEVKVEMEIVFSCSYFLLCFCAFALPQRYDSTDLAYILPSVMNDAKERQWAFTRS